MISAPELAIEFMRESWLRGPAAVNTDRTLRGGCMRPPIPKPTFRQRYHATKYSFQAAFADMRRSSQPSAKRLMFVEP